MQFEYSYTCELNSSEVISLIALIFVRMIDQDMLLIILSHKQFLSYGTLTFHAVVTTLSYIMLSWQGQVTYR